MSVFNMHIWSEDGNVENYQILKKALTFFSIKSIRDLQSRHRKFVLWNNNVWISMLFSDMNFSCNSIFHGHLKYSPVCYFNLINLTFGKKIKSNLERAKRFRSLLTSTWASQPRHTWAQEDLWVLGSSPPPIFYSSPLLNIHRHISFSKSSPSFKSSIGD